MKRRRTDMPHQVHFAVQAWADRNPGTRYPLLFMALLLLWGLAGMDAT